VPRGKPAEPQHLDAVVAAAGRVFARTGYRRTRMADVAAEAGLSPGALYTYVAGKAALFHLVVTGEPATELPVPNPPPEETAAAVDRRLRATMPTRAVRAASRADAPDDAAAEVRMLVGALYDAVEDQHELLAVIERSAPDLPDLAARYYARGRRGFVHDIGAWLQRRADQGALRPVPDPDVAARYLLETVAWFAWHRHDDPDSAMIADAAARTTVVDMAVAALLPREA